MVTLLYQFAKLFTMDLLGYSSFAIPGLGELSDVVFAPISAIIFYKMFGGWKGTF